MNVLIIPYCSSYIDPTVVLTRPKNLAVHQTQAALATVFTRCSRRHHSGSTHSDNEVYPTLTLENKNSL